jgi:riboflavin kinase/FMN adenylyltransferase
VSNVGSRPTFAGAGFAIETHFLDQAPELSGLYGEWIEIAFLARLRSEVRFDSAEQLKRQIAADVARARRFFEQVAPEGRR